MKTINKFNLLFASCALLLLASCKDDIVRDPSPVVVADCQTVYFSANNKTSYELEPTAPTSLTVKVQREDSTIAAEVPIKVMKNDSNIFVIPATATFTAGQGTTTVTVSFPDSKIGIPYSFEIAIDGEKYLNPYSLKVPVVKVSINRVKWDLLGDGQFYDSFSFYSVANVQIYYSDLKKEYRIPNPYSNALLVEAEWDNWINGPVSEYINFSIKNGKVIYKSWYTGLNYNGVEGQAVQAFFPSYLGDIRDITTYDKEDEQSIVDPKDSKLLRLFPRIYIIGVGGFGLKACYISLPGGPDLNTIL